MSHISTWRRRIAKFAILVALFGVLASVLLAQDDARDARESKKALTSNTLTAEEKKAGWQLLFDGKTTDAFRTYRGDAINGKWKVEDGALTMTAGGGGNLVTKEQFDSFELVLEYRVSKGGNSGLMFHVQESETEPGMNGPEIQIQDNVDGRDPQKAGWLYQLYQPAVDPKTNKPIDATKPAGKWNRIRLLLDGVKGEIDINGVRYATFELWSADWNDRVAKSKFVQWPNFGKAKTGHLCLQDHGDPVAFRNIKIRRIQSK